jgi:hypothetical protein
MRGSSLSFFANTSTRWPLSGFAAGHGHLNRWPKQTRWYNQQPSQPTGGRKFSSSLSSPRMKASLALAGPIRNSNSSQLPARAMQPEPPISRPFIWPGVPRGLYSSTGTRPPSRPIRAASVSKEHDPWLPSLPSMLPTSNSTTAPSTPPPSPHKPFPPGSRSPRH